ncbi:hypothetical protein BSZ35_04655 [Salinibacter sp. 10B]|uniref:hypothetical protein n=1 Tax=Salinibacter sp. 10B TaxID=1923971 RepID=UPI000CF48751|nr:hypothetical protein [Salinibacter sp. 10B]PQJ33998.1 hypothetical protein BSZ35_04655 [Salinibacter sp. 10B]
MADDNDFFGSVFDDPEDDPLLGGDDSESEDTPSDEGNNTDPIENGAPSWVSDESSDTPSDASGPADTGPERKEIVVVQRGESQEGLDELNEAVGEGWRLVQLSLAQPNGERATSRADAQRFVAILEQDSPQSLFDFGAP